MGQKDKIIQHLSQAVSSFERGISLFENGDYNKIPKGKEEQVMACCKECSKNMNTVQELDSIYSKVYQHFSDGGNETDCRIAKNRWCFAKIEFAKARIKNLISKNKRNLIKN